MGSLAMLSEQDFRSAMAQGEVRALRVHEMAMGLGLVLFGISTISIATHRESVPATTPDAVKMIEFASILHAIMFAASLVLSDVLFRAALRPSKLPALERFGAGTAAPATAMAMAQNCVALIRKAFLLRLVLREGPALLGLAVCIPGGPERRDGRVPCGGLNALSAVYAIAVFALTLPNEERLVAIFLRHFARSSV